MPSGLGAPGVYFRLLLLGLDSERGTALTVSDSLSLRAFLGYELSESPPDHSTISRTRRRISLETHEQVFGWVLEQLREAGLANGGSVAVDATMLFANAALRTLRRKDTQQGYREFVEGLAAALGVATPTVAELAEFDRKRKGKTLSNKEWESPTDPDARMAKMKDGTTHLAHKAEHAVDLESGALVGVERPSFRGRRRSGSNRLWSGARGGGAEPPRACRGKRRRATGRERSGGALRDKRLAMTAGCTTPRAADGTESNLGARPEPGGYSRAIGSSPCSEVQPRESPRRS